MARDWGRMISRATSNPLAFYGSKICVPAPLTTSTKKTLSANHSQRTTCRASRACPAPGRFCPSPPSRGRSRIPLREGGSSSSAAGGGRAPRAAANQRGAAAAASLWGRWDPISAASAVWRKPGLGGRAAPWPAAPRARSRGRWWRWVRAGGSRGG